MVLGLDLGGVDGDTLGCLDLVSLAFVGDGLGVLVGQDLHLLILDHLVAELLGDLGLIQGQNSGHSGVSGGVAHADDVLTLLKDVGSLFHAVGGHFADGELDANALGLALSQLLGLDVAGKLLIGLFQIASGSREVNLDNFLAGNLAGVGDGSGHDDVVLFDGDGLSLHLKGGVAQAIAEGIGNFLAEGVKVTVADVDVVLVVLVVDVLVVGAEVLSVGIVGIVDGPGVGQLAGGVHSAVEDSDNRVAAAHAGLGHQQQCVKILVLAEELGVHDAAHVQQDDGLFERSADLLDVGSFVVTQLIVELAGGTVGELAGVAGDDVERNVSALGGLDVCINVVQIVHRFRRAHAAAVGGIVPLLIKGIQVVVAGHGVAGILEALLNGDDGSLVDVAGAGAALNGVTDASAEQRNLALLGDGQNAVVFQKGHALGCCIIGKFGAFLLTVGDLVRGRGREGAGAEAEDHNDSQSQRENAGKRFLHVVLLPFCEQPVFSSRHCFTR